MVDLVLCYVIMWVFKIIISSASGTLIYTYRKVAEENYQILSVALYDRQIIGNIFKCILSYHKHVLVDNQEHLENKKENFRGQCYIMNFLVKY